MEWYTILPKLWNMSLTASLVILAVLAARLLLRKAPAVLRYALWSVVLFRLLCPVSFSAAFSLVGAVDAPTTPTGRVEYIPEDIVHTEYPEVSLPIVGPTVNDAITAALPQGEEQLRADPLEAPITLLTWGWMAGVLVMLAYGAAGYIRLRRTLVGSICLREDIRLADGIGTAFVLGVLRPVIWLPSALPEQERALVIRHEQQHIRCGDHIFRFLGWCALCLHWFNPLVWLAFWLSGRDMESACDEAVLREADGDIRAAYSYALLHCAAGHSRFAGTPLAFGENNVKARIARVMKYKRPAFWAVAIAAVLCAVLAVCALADPLRDDPNDVRVSYVQLPEGALTQAEQDTPAIGDSVVLGAYEQDNDSSNGAEPIEWVVVDKKGQSLLLLSRYVLEHRPCDAEDAQAYAWETCSLRTWLNSEFVVNAFTEEELAQLQWLDVDSEDNPVSGLDAGTVTRDLVFIPSVQEMTRWFATDTQRATTPTAYAAAQGARRGEGVQWWLRTPGSSAGNAAVVDVDGTVDANGHLAWYPSVGVRPCIVLDAVYEKEDVQTAESFVEQQESAAVREESEKVQPESMLPEEEITVPTLEPILAQQTVQLILGTLRITEENGISFHIPTLPPKAEDGTELFITLNATCRLQDGSYKVQRLVDDVTGWKSGDVMAVSPTMDKDSELIRIMLRASYRTPMGENSWKELTASYVELTAPFVYNAAPILEEPSASIEYKNGESLIHVNLQDGSRALLSLALPEGFALAENWEKSIDPAMPPAIAVLWQGDAVGTLRLYPFSGAHDEVDPAAEELPMPIFAAVALSNHVNYEKYAVVHCTDTGAAATAKYRWQQLEAAVGNAAELPWYSRDCILAYDWSAMSCYMELTLEEELLSPQELEKVAHSVRWQKNG